MTFSVSGFPPETSLPESHSSSLDKPGYRLGFRFCHATIIAVACAAMLLSSCGNKKEVAQAPPPPPPPPAPTATIQANPATISSGESSVVTWKAENADDIEIEPLGKVEASGSKDVSPSESTTYRLVVKGPGGSQEAVARVTVMKNAAPKTEVQEEDIFGVGAGRQDVFFGLDEYSISAEQQSTVTNDARFLKDHPDLRVMIEGHCDEHGSVEYNLALGDNRANEVKSALVKAGISSDRIATISFGKERPFCMEATEDCWKQNRRAHIVAQKQDQAELPQ